MAISKMSIKGRKGMGNITLSFKSGKLDKINASGKMADLIARGMAHDLGIEKQETDKERIE